MTKSLQLQAIVRSMKLQMKHMSHCNNKPNVLQIQHRWFCLHRTRSPPSIQSVDLGFFQTTNDLSTSWNWRWGVAGSGAPPVEIRGGEPPVEVRGGESPSPRGRHAASIETGPRHHLLQSKVVASRSQWRDDLIWNDGTVESGGGRRCGGLGKQGTVLIAGR
jgi:hypothetical protein